MSAPEGKLGELSLNSIMNIIAQFDECGIMAILMTGGEPLIRRRYGGEILNYSLSSRRLSQQREEVKGGRFDSYTVVIYNYFRSKNFFYFNFRRCFF